ncbi:hypothetical protein D3Z47_10315 [Lachnospiraceae bacterium]|nr:hypothetical protein [Lachnospiraceae bacterium]
MRLFWKVKLVLLVAPCLAALFLMPVSVGADGLVSIDTDKKYEGMNASFAKGYMPSIKKDTMNLVVPFVAQTALMGDALYVGVSFEREENSPFVYQNYRKRVKKSDKGVYLYRCKIKLRKGRVNGQYPLYLTVGAQVENEVVSQQFTVYVEISDGKPTAFFQESPEKEAGVAEDDGLGVQGAGQAEEADGKNAKATHQPRVLLVQGNAKGMLLQAGSSASWKITAKNCSSSQDIENIKVTLLYEGAELLFEKQAWYFERAAAGGSMDLSQEVTALTKAAAGQAAVQFLFEYEDKDGNAYNTTETAHLSICQVQQAQLANLSFPEGIYEADTDMLSFQVQNTGLAVLYNVRVRMEGTGLFPEKELFLGNLDPGMSADGEIQVFAGTLDMDADGNFAEDGYEKYGETTGKVYFSYEDGEGSVTQQEFLFHTEIKKPEMVELKVEKQKEETNQWWITILFFLFLLLVLIIVWLYLRMKYYQRRGRVYEGTKAL